jgi:hypothetical protein
MWPFTRRATPAPTPVPSAAAEKPAYSEAMLAEARRIPNGWVYEIDGGYDPAGAVPPEAIRGAHKVDARGNLTGEFTPNPNYRRK